MTTDYLGEQCPITRRCLRQIKAMLSTDLFPDLGVDGLEDLEERCKVCSADPNYVRLRGFLVIEEMLSIIKDIYEKGYKTAMSPQLYLQLAVRSWGSLSIAKKTLEQLVDEVELEVAETKLGGVKYAQENVIYISHKVSDAADTAQRATVAQHLGNLAKVVKPSIVVLRPYLKNTAAPIAILGDEVAFFLREVYGATAIEPLMNLTRKIMDVKL